MIKSKSWLSHGLKSASVALAVALRQKKNKKKTLHHDVSELGVNHHRGGNRLQCWKSWGTFQNFLRRGSVQLHQGRMP